MSFSWESAERGLAVVLQTGVVIVGMAMGYQMIRSDLSAAIDQGRQNATELRLISVQVQALEVSLKAQAVQLEDFHAIYERDFDTYIREPKKR